MKKFVFIMLLGVALAVFAAEPKPHSTVTYAIVPVKDVSEVMLQLCAQNSMATILTSTNGILAVLKWIEWKEKTDPMPPSYSNDLAFTSSQLEYNEKMSVYPWAHKETPALLRKYKQYTHAQIIVELHKPEWIHPVFALAALEL